jgi:hypothetical protein
MGGGMLIFRLFKNEITEYRKWWISSKTTHYNAKKFIEGKGVTIFTPWKCLSIIWAWKIKPLTKGSNTPTRIRFSGNYIAGCDPIKENPNIITTKTTTL